MGSSAVSCGTNRLAHLDRDHENPSKAAPRHLTQPVSAITLLALPACVAHPITRQLVHHVMLRQDVMLLLSMCIYCPAWWCVLLTV